MANSSTYLVQTRNRCIVSVYGDTAGTIAFGVTASAFNNGSSGAYVDPQINKIKEMMRKLS